MPLAGIFEFTHLALDRAGKGPLFMAEEFGFDHFRGQRPHIDRHIGRLILTTDGMDGPGHQFLAGAGLADDQHRIGFMGNGLDQGIEAEHGRMAADQAVKAGAALPGGGQLLLQATVFQHQLPPLDGPRQGGQDDVLVHRLLEKIVGPFLDRLHRQADIAVPGDQDHRQIGILLQNPFQQDHAIHLRHADVGQHCGKSVPIDTGQGLERIAEGSAPHNR